MNIQELVIYPIKGCGGISLPSAKITPLGIATLNLLLRDRSFVIAKQETGKFITQRQMGKLALIHVALDPPELLNSPTAPSDLSNVHLVLTAPGMSTPLRIPLAPNPHLKPCPVTVWAWSGQGYDQGTDAAEWLSEFLGIPAKLIRFGGLDKKKQKNTPFRRPVVWPWAADGNEVAFADGFPYLLATNASLQDLNDRLPEGSPHLLMNRFRPNIIVDGATAWEEDEWLHINIIRTTNGDDTNTADTNGDTVVLHNVKPCSRCKVPTIDQSTGIDGFEPNKTMHTFRSGKTLGWEESPPAFKHAIFFGINMCPIMQDGCDGDDDGGVVSVGDDVVVASRMEGPPGKGQVDVVVDEDGSWAAAPSAAVVEESKGGCIVC